MSDWLGANPTTTLVAWLTTNTNCPFSLGQTPANKGNFQGDIIGFAHQSTLWPYPIVRVPTIREWEMGNGERTRLFIAGPWTRKRNQNRSLHTNAMTKGNKFFIWEAGRADKLKCSCHVSSYVNLTLKMKQYLFWDVKEGKALSSGHQHTNHHFNNYRSFGSWGPTRICSWVYS